MSSKVTLFDVLLEHDKDAARKLAAKLGLEDQLRASVVRAKREKKANGTRRPVREDR